MARLHGDGQSGESVVVLCKDVGVGILEKVLDNAGVAVLWSQCYKTFYGRNYVAVGVTQSKSLRNTPLVA